MAASAGTGFAQCPSDDATTTNNDCANAAPIAIGTTTGLSVQGGVEDFWTISIPPGQVLTVDCLFMNAIADLDLNIFINSACSAVSDTGTTTTDNEQVVFQNFSAAAIDAVIRVFIWNNPPGSCNDYSLALALTPNTLNPCFGVQDDSEEDNDTCATAVIPSANPLIGMFASKLDPDHYRVSVPAGNQLIVDATFFDAFGNLDLRIFDASCTTELDAATSFSDNETAMAWNTSAAAVDMIIQVSHLITDNTYDCNFYNLTWVVAPDFCSAAMDDMFEDNDDCTTAAPITAGTYTGLLTRLRTLDTDWYTVNVPDTATITVDALFLDIDGDIDLALENACTGTLLSGGATTNDNETASWTNTTGAAVDVTIEVFVWQGSTPECNNYDLIIDIQGGIPPNLTPYCFGDGSGTPCPCGNDSTAGHPGGCANSSGSGAILVATGNPTVGADTLNFDLSSASRNSFALLVSGVNQLPQTGGCIGCGLVAFDGLRCAGGAFLRHGSRSTNGAGATGNGWGPPGGPAGGLIASNGFMVGQTRNFFAFYRDDAMLVCQTGQNSSNGIQVTFN